MMALVDVPAVMMVDRRKRGAHQIEKQIHADREIRAVNEAGVVFFYLSPHIRQVVIPAGCPHHQVLSSSHACADVIENAIRTGEIYDYVKGREQFGSQCRCLRVFSGPKTLGPMTAFASDFGYQRSSFSRTKNKDSHT